MQLNLANLRSRLTRKQRGVSLIEVMLGLAILGAMMAGGYKMLSNARSQTNGRLQADTIGNFQQMAGQYFMANRTNIEAAMGGDATQQGTFCLINVAADGTGGTVSANSTKRNCAFDATALRKNKLWPAYLSTDASKVGRYVAIVRQILDSTNTPTGADEMLIVLAPLASGSVMTTGTVTFTGDVKRAADEAQASMAALGANGGFVPPGKDYGPCQYNSTTKQVCGNGWKVTLSDFIN